MSKKYYIVLDDCERGAIINCLNEKRNNLMTDGKYTNAVDEVLLKILNAKQKKFQAVYKDHLLNFYIGNIALPNPDVTIRSYHVFSSVFTSSRLVVIFLSLI